jgi:glycerophosphoryl diester phosphodiesterase
MRNRPRPSPWPVPWFAHQGYWKSLAEKSTRTAFRRAAAVGVPGIELDVRVVDGALMVGHDRAHATRANAPSLEQVLALVAQEAQRRGHPRPVINVELKERRTAALVLSVLDRAIAKRGWKPTDFIVSAFTRRETAQEKHNLLGELRHVAVHSSLPLGIVVRYARNVKSHIAQAGRLRACSIHPKRTEATPAYVDSCHRAGFTVYPWTARSDGQIARLTEAGVDGYFVDLCLVRN